MVAVQIVNERFYTERLGREPFDDPDLAADALFTIWTATIYG